MSTISAFTRSRNRLYRMYPTLQEGVEKIKRDVFGHYPKPDIRAKTGYKFNRTQLKGVYINQYYPEPIMTYARKVEKGLLTDQEQRRQDKLRVLRRRGAGPPKKGAGKKKKK
mmetsp:Transcript_18900/g.24309  ORF Transcript_18900/g.24309 Transcript_18900/m.24309 type:complete len:112 (-) Transcript_18900:66-401(-)